MRAADIFAGQAGDPDLLAELYDLEHDAVTEDLAFYAAMCRRQGDGVLDVGCGSGRLFSSFLQGAATHVVGVDASPALLRRAAGRITARAELAAAQRSGRLRVELGDARRLGALHLGRFALVVLAGVLPHLDGRREWRRALRACRARLRVRGRLVIDDLGPGRLPARNLGASVDWEARWRGRRVVRRSSLVRQATPEGLRVAFSTVAEVADPDGTIAWVPADHRLWYPSADVLNDLTSEAGLTVEERYGSHQLEPLGPHSARRILVVRREERRRRG